MASKKTPKQIWNKHVNKYKTANRADKTVIVKKKIKVPRMTKFVKIIKAVNAFRAFKLVREAEVTINDTDILIEKALVNWTVRFGDRTEIVLENVMKVLSAVQAKFNNGKDPMLLAQGKEQSLIDLLAGVKALQAAGAGGSMALRSYIQKVKANNQGLTPEQAEIEAVKQAGKGSQIAPQIQQTLKQYQQAVQQGNQQQIEEIKRQFTQTYQFYQQLMARIQGGRNQQIPAGAPTSAEPGAKPVPVLSRTPEQRPGPSPSQGSQRNQMPLR